MKKIKTKKNIKYKKRTITNKKQKGGADESKKIIPEHLIRYFWFKTFDIIDDEINKKEFINFIEYLISDITQNKGGTVFHSKNDEFNGIVFVFLKIFLEKKIKTLKEFKHNTENDKIEMIKFIMKTIIYARIRRVNMVNNLKMYKYICSIFGIIENENDSNSNFQHILNEIKKIKLPIYDKCTNPEYNTNTNYPYESTRVKINESDTECNNYINANDITKSVKFDLEPDTELDTNLDLDLNNYLSNENIILFNGNYIETICPLNKTKDTFIQMLSNFKVKRIILIEDNVLSNNQCLLSPADYTNFFDSWAEDEVLDKYEKNIINKFHIFLFDVKSKLMIDINYDINKPNDELLKIHNLNKEKQLQLHLQMQSQKKLQIQGGRPKKSIINSNTNNKFVIGVKVQLKSDIIDTHNQCLSTNKYGVIINTDKNTIYVKCGKNKFGTYSKEELEFYIDPIKKKEALQEIPAKPTKPLPEVIPAPAAPAKPNVPVVKPVIPQLPVPLPAVIPAPAKPDVPVVKPVIPQLPAPLPAPAAPAAPAKPVVAQDAKRYCYT